MGKEVKIFFPNRRLTAVSCGVVFMALLLNIHYLLGGSGFIILLHIHIVVGVVYLYVHAAPQKLEAADIGRGCYNIFFRQGK